MQSQPRKQPTPDANHQSLLFEETNRIPSRSKPQSSAHLVPNLLFILGPPLPPHLRSLDIGRALVIRLGQHAHDRDEDLLHALDGRPALRGVLVVVGVVTGRVEDRDANRAIGVD